MQKECPCGNFITKIKPSRFDRTKYCSKVCFYKFHGRKSGLKYLLVKKNPTWFKKGFPSWNKGIPQSVEFREKQSRDKKGKHYSARTEFRKGHKTWNKGISHTAIHQERHPFFTTGIRSYVKHAKRNGKLPICEDCGKSGTFGTKIHVHHIDGNRNNNDITNLKVLCSKCHVNIHQNWKLR